MMALDDILLATSGGDVAAGGPGGAVDASGEGGVGRTSGAPATFSGVLPLENGSGFSGRGARSRVDDRRSMSDCSGVSRGGRTLSTAGSICT